MKQQDHLKNLIKLLKRYYPNVKCALDHETPFQLLIATILSAQCTDARVNTVTPKLFESYPDASSLAKARIDKLESIVHSTGFFKNKAKNIKACAQRIVHCHEGEVPENMEFLVELPGVGRKTANVVMGNAFGIASGVVVDTHVTRLSRRLGVAEGKSAVAIEKKLNKLVPKKHWIEYPHWLITHGRAVCKARKPICETCFLQEICPKKL